VHGAFARFARRFIPDTAKAELFAEIRQEASAIE
jgi:hypothetical protein